MTCKSTLCSVTTASQTLTAGGVVAFNTNTVLTGSSIAHTGGSTTVTIGNAGIYQVTFDGDILPTEAGGTTVQLYNNGTAVTGAQASFTGAATSLVHVTFNTIIRVLRSCSCISNAANLQVQVADNMAVANANITVVKLV